MGSTYLFYPWRQLNCSRLFIFVCFYPGKNRQDENNTKYKTQKFAYYVGISARKQYIIKNQKHSSGVLCAVLCAVFFINK